MVKNFRKKPVVIQAIQFTGSNALDIIEWGEDYGAEIRSSDDGQTVEITTLEGIMRADKGDYVIKGIKGEFYPCKPDIFDSSYDPE